MRGSRLGVGVGGLLVCVAVGGGIFGAAASGAGTTTGRLSVSSGGLQGNAGSLEGMIAADGRYVVFTSFASNLIRRDTNRAGDVFVRDLRTGTTRRVSVSASGGQVSDHSWFPSISADGRDVAFRSSAADLVPGDTNGESDIFVRDRVAKTTERVSVSTAGVEGNAMSRIGLISRDGRFVVFDSQASNLVAGDTNGKPDVFVRDLAKGTTTRISVSSQGAQAQGGTSFYQPALAVSGNDRYLAFQSDAANLVRRDTNHVSDVFVRDRWKHTTTRVSVAGGGGQANGESAGGISLSADGRYVAFASQASNLVPGDTNGVSDVFVRDRLAKTTQRISTAVRGGAGAYSPAISADGRVVVYVSEDAAGLGTIVAFDRLTGETRRVSTSRSGGLPNMSSQAPSITADDHWVVFTSYASNLVPSDTNAAADVFARGPLAWGN